MTIVRFVIAGSPGAAESLVRAMFDGTGVWSSPTLGGHESGVDAFDQDYESVEEATDVLRRISGRSSNPDEYNPYAIYRVEFTPAITKVEE